ncbi:MAG: signal peptidase I [Gammaproteobacteria bacterium]
MRIDLELVLVIGTLLTGGVWLLDHFVLARQRRALSAVHAGGTVRDAEVELGIRDPWYVEYAKSFFPVLFIVLVLRSFVAEPFRIPSGSMMPTLLVGDFILVNKFAYGVRLPVINKKIIDIGAPQHGDVVVFRFPKDPADDYIKRIVGLPGDRIAYVDKVLYVNGSPAEQKLVGAYEDQRSMLVYDERLASINHEILISQGHGNTAAEGEWTVPPDRYFVMGDNRDNSNDSRFWDFVPASHLVGKAFLVWLNWDWHAGVFDTSRMGHYIR